MSPLSFADRLRAGERLLGTLVQSPHPEVALRLAGRGFDWLFLDGEHGGYGPRQAAAALAVLDGLVPCLLRVPSLEPDVLEASAACGVAGLILPHVDHPSQAEAAVRILRGRGLAVVQAESGEALQNIGAIAAVPGVDAVFVGPYDLSASLGIPEQFQHPRFLDAVADIARTCREARMPHGIFRMSAAEMRPHEAEGFTLLAVGLDGTGYSGQ
ncbi:MAG TPA: aldolase/citrate lyase family protein [Geothrix sp.]|nr:aldolase/citrate lyase family protein [Geothrix sp.]